jgi:hypothetical protein
VLIPFFRPFPMLPGNQSKSCPGQNEACQQGKQFPSLRSAFAWPSLSNPDTGLDCLYTASHLCLGWSRRGAMPGLVRQPLGRSAIIISAFLAPIRSCASALCVQASRRSLWRLLKRCILLFPRRGFGRFPGGSRWDPRVLGLALLIKIMLRATRWSLVMALATLLRGPGRLACGHHLPSIAGAPGEPGVPQSNGHTYLSNIPSGGCLAAGWAPRGRRRRDGSRSTWRRQRLPW